ncbi:hypothetical protein [Dictyobacter arantiisoli]|uniref:Uncharacterized protein n=1 Tax=Dictyobacter arantiisoli TaxID=2014874 RepID=A0A5A5TLM3_9CHLR|nr:hypothetical protein [Dictyobacter arantiisoli]GCF12043.1 hypothetical protein KDI_56070 [Dictyobacter arantiisoli]
MIKKRLDAQIRAENYDFIKAESEQRGIPMNTITDDLLTQAIAIKRGEVIEQQSLPVIREIIQTEVRKGLAQQRQDIREDMQLEFTNEFKAISRASDNRLAALIVRTLRDSSIVRRLAYTILSRSFGADFASKAYEDAKMKAGQELASRSKSKEGLED